VGGEVSGGAQVGVVGGVVVGRGEDAEVQVDLLWVGGIRPAWCGELGVLEGEGW
jgi:hypothetical protein